MAHVPINPVNDLAGDTHMSIFSRSGRHKAACLCEIFFRTTVFKNCAFVFNSKNKITYFYLLHLS
jgi:hypothetical protein